MRLQPDRAARALAGDRELPHEEADGCWPARARAARRVGLLLPPRRRQAASERDPRPRRGRTMTELRDSVRERYAAAATSVKRGMAADDVTEDACCEPSDGYGLKFYDVTERGTLPDEAVLASLGCGNPTAVADLQEGQTVLDLGSGGGIDVLLSAQRVGSTGYVYGLDMTDEMLA